MIRAQPQEECPVSLHTWPDGMRAEIDWSARRSRLPPPRRLPAIPLKIRGSTMRVIVGRRQPGREWIGMQVDNRNHHRECEDKKPEAHETPLSSAIRPGGSTVSFWPPRHSLSSFEPCFGQWETRFI